MSSHGFQLSKALRNFARVKDVHRENVKDEYTRGLYNGLELAWSMLCDKEPNFKNKQDKKSDKITDQKIKEMVKGFERF